MESKKPVESPEFWRERMHRVLATGGQLHQIVYDTTNEGWTRIMQKTAKILFDRVRPIRSRVLDVGCGYGALCDSLHEVGLLAHVRYVGVDVSPDLIAIARMRYESPDGATPAASLPYAADVRFHVANVLEWDPAVRTRFDWAICRSFGPMLAENGREESWLRIKARLRGYCRNLLQISYNEVDDPAADGPLPWSVGWAKDDWQTS